MIRTACFCSANGLRTEPRFRRHALAFAREFPDVKTLVIDGGVAEATQIDRDVFRGLDNIEYRRAVFPTKSTRFLATAKAKLGEPIANEN